MAGRSYIRDRRSPTPPHLGRIHRASMIDDPHFQRIPSLQHHPHPSILAMEDHLVAQQRETQTLILDNQHLAATHVALKQDLIAAQHDLRAAAATAAKSRDKMDADARELYSRSVKAEAEVMGVEGMRAELAQVQADVQKLRAAREELADRVRGVREEILRARSELSRAPNVRAEIEVMHKEIQKGRAAVEYEKKSHASNLELSQAMEKNMVKIARDIEKLRGELTNAEKRARAAAAATAAGNPVQEYGRTYGEPDVAYGTSAYSDAYNVSQAQHRGADIGSQYGLRGADGGVSQYGPRGVSPYGSATAVVRGPYDFQPAHGHR